MLLGRSDRDTANSLQLWFRFSPQLRPNVAATPHKVLRFLLLDGFRPLEEVAHVLPRLGCSGSIAPVKGASPKAKYRASPRRCRLVPPVSIRCFEQPLHRGVVLHPHALQSASKLVREMTPDILAASLAGESCTEDCSPHPRALSLELCQEQHSSLDFSLGRDFALVARTLCTQLQAYLG